MYQEIFYEVAGLGLDPEWGVLRGWGEYFRTGNASTKFQQVDRYVERSLVRLLGSRGSWRHRPFHAREWSHRRFVEEHGLYRLLGTIRYPEARMRRPLVDLR